MVKHEAEPTKFSYLKLEQLFRAYFEMLLLEQPFYIAIRPILGFLLLKMPSKLLVKYLRIFLFCAITFKVEKMLFLSIMKYIRFFPCSFWKILFEEIDFLWMGNSESSTTKFFALIFCWAKERNAIKNTIA